MDEANEDRASVTDAGEGHTFKAYDDALGNLRRHAHAMGVLVVDQVETAVRALLEADREAAEQVLVRERRRRAPRRARGSRQGLAALI